MKAAAVMLLSASLILLGAEISRRGPLCETESIIPLYGEVQNIVYQTESPNSAVLAEKVANLIIAHGMGDSFQSIYVIDNKGDEYLSPLMILKLSEKGATIPVKDNKKLDELVEEVTFLFANLFSDSRVSLYIQNNNHPPENLLEAVYDPGEKKVNKKLKGPYAGPDESIEKPAPGASSTAAEEEEAGETAMENE